ncbi:hypothetical protein MMC15_001245 [Xylographa vitiligo]|nr:hypothetical protein [Xylographa vitiligo]
MNSETYTARLERIRISHQIDNSAHFCGKDTPELCATTQPGSENGTSVYRKDEEELRINHAEDPQPSHDDRQDDQPGLELANHQPMTKLTGSSPSADWHPKLHGSPVRDFLVQVQGQEHTIHTVILSNQDDDLIPIISPNTLLLEVISEAGTSSDHAKKNFRTYPVNRSIMSVIRWIIMSFIIFLGLLALLFRLLADRSAKQKAGIVVLILESLVVITTFRKFHNGTDNDVNYVSIVVYTND